MIIIDKRSRVPVYEQIKNELMTLIRLGTLSPHEKLPSIRAIASETGINVNTVKKAFSELEAAGVIYSVSGTGCFVNDNALANDGLRQVVYRDITDAVKSAISRGIGKEEIIELVNQLYKGESGND